MVLHNPPRTCTAATVEPPSVEAAWATLDSAQLAFLLQGGEKVRRWSNNMAGGGDAPATPEPVCTLVDSSRDAALDAQEHGHAGGGGEQTMTYTHIAEHSNAPAPPPPQSPLLTA